MNLLPRIYIIQASDAALHSETFRKILSDLESENRISGFTILDQDIDLSSISDKLKKGDMILIVLTDKIQAEREEIELKCKKLKSEIVGLRVAEILVDNISYDNDFITFPADLRPIGDRADIDETWNNIVQKLRDLFPYQNKKPIVWKGYVMYGVFVLIGGLLIWGIFKLISENGPEAQFTYYVGNAEQDTVAACYAPCSVRFINDSQNFDSSQWQIEDSLFTETQLGLTFMEPGDKEIRLTVFKNNKKSTHTKNLLIKSPPVADFEIINNGCTAPCTIRFTNMSSLAESYSWDFGNGLSSSEYQPEVRYVSPNEYEVTLVATNEDGRTSKTKKDVTVIQDDSTFVDFTFSGNIGTVPKCVTFSNQSQNADSIVWQFPGGSPSTSDSPNPSVAYEDYDTYSVTLTVTRNGHSAQEKKEVEIKMPDIFPPDYIPDGYRPDLHPNPCNL